MKLLLLASILTLQPLAANTLSGDIAAYFSDPDSGFSITMFGNNGVSFFAPNIVNPGGGSQQALCTFDCDFSGWLHGNEGGTATIGLITSASFSFDLTEIGDTKDFVGFLDLYQPFTTFVLATVPIETFLVDVFVANGLPEHVESDFQFSDNQGPPDTPEPTASILVAIGLLGLALYSRRHRPA